MTEPTTSEPARTIDRGWRWKLPLVVILGFTMIVLTIYHVHGVNGPWWWTWPWRRLGWAIYPLLIGASIPFFVGRWLYARGKITVTRALVFVTLSTLCLQLTALSVQPLGLRRLPAIVQNSVNTSYYNAAEVLVEQMEHEGKSYRDWMEIYPDLMDVLMLHAGYKPPGLIFYYIVMIKLFGAGGGAALAGGLLIALLACASVWCTYAMIRFFSGDERAALFGASFFALTPSLILFLPQFDQAYPVLVCLMLIAWAKALRVGGRMYAIAFGALFALMLFLTPTFLMFGVFLAVYTLLQIADHGRRGFTRAVERSLIAAATIALLYFLLYVATGFDPIRTFSTAAARSQAHLVTLIRPWPMHSVWDVLDVALGTGWISAPLIALGAAYVWRSQAWRDPTFRLVFLGLLQIAMSVAVAVFPGENARLMLPMMPLLMAPIGIELSRWPTGARLTVYLLLVLITAAICQNMIFLYMGPEIEGVPKL